MASYSSLTRKSSSSEVIDFLVAQNLTELLDAFKENDIDGDDFHSLELRDIVSIIPKLKLRKKFLATWRQVTEMDFDVYGVAVPVLTSCTKTPCASPEILFSSSSSPIAPCTEYGNHEPLQPEQQTEMTPRRSPRKHPNSSQYTPSPPQKRLCVRELDVSPLSPKTSTWLETFSIPERWEPDVEEGLKRGTLTPGEKNTLNRQLCTTLMALTDQIGRFERDHVAVKLVERYPFLKGSFGTGHQFWSKKIKERIENVQKRSARKKRLSMQQEGIIVPKGKPGRKKAQNSSTVPPIPDGETEATMQEQKAKLLSECKKQQQNSLNIRTLMDNTFPLRRKEVVTLNLRVWELLRDYPPLGDGKGNGLHLKAELGRILGEEKMANEMKTRFTSYWRPKLLAVMKASRHKAVAEIVEVLDDVEFVNEQETENRCIMASLPYLLGDRDMGNHCPGDLFWKVVSSDSDTDAEKEVESSATPRLISTGSFSNIQPLYLAAEGMVVCRFRKLEILNAVISLIASYYTLNVQYPKGRSGHSKNVFLFLDHILMNRTPSAVPLSVDNFLSQVKRAC